MNITNPNDIPEVMREALYTHEVFRKLGFPSKDLFLDMLDFDKEIQVGVTVKQDDKKSTVLIGAIKKEEQVKFLDAWPLAVNLWNETCNSDDRWDFEHSIARTMVVGIIAGLAMRDFKFNKDAFKKQCPERRVSITIDGKEEAYIDSAKEITEDLDDCHYDGGCATLMGVLLKNLYRDNPVRALNVAACFLAATVKDAGGTKESYMKMINHWWNNNPLAVSCKNIDSLEGFDALAETKLEVAREAWSRAAFEKHGKAKG